MENFPSFSSSLEQKIQCLINLIRVVVKSSGFGDPTEGVQGGCPAGATQVCSLFRDEDSGGQAFRRSLFTASVTTWKDLEKRAITKNNFFFFNLKDLPVCRVNTFAYQAPAVLIFLRIVFLLSETPGPHCLLLSSGPHVSLHHLTAMMSLTSLWGFRAYEIKFDFLLLVCLYVTWMIRPAKEP